MSARSDDHGRGCLCDACITARLARADFALLPAEGAQDDASRDTAPETNDHERLDLELYADRLARHAQRLADEMAAARLRIAWADLERDARQILGPGQSLLLESLGVLAEADGNAADEAFLNRRREQLHALAALQVIVEKRIERL